jgi:flagellar basal-body rod protein FlgG
MFQQLIRVMSDNSLSHMTVLDRVAGNVSNYNTNGYKALRFENYMLPDGRVSGVERRNMAQGSQHITNRPLDVAIEGEGYLPVTQPDGTVAYTRDGALAVNAQGYLVTQYGDIVGEGIQMPAQYDKLLILPDGTVQVQENKIPTPRTLGRILLATFPNPEGLAAVGYNKLLPTEASGQVRPAAPSVLLKQGNLERSNVNIYHQIDQVLRLNAGVISSFRVIKYTDDLYRQAVNLRQ